MAYNKLQTLRDNTAAIDLAWAIINDRQPRTDENLEILRKYKGFGGIKEVLNIDKYQSDKDVEDDVMEYGHDMAAALQGLVVVIMQNWFHLSLHQEVVESIKQSVLTAFYTPSPIVRAVGDAVEHTFAVFGIKAESMLETSAGIGGFLPIAKAGVRKVAFEKDFVSSVVLAALNDDTDVFNHGFETIDAHCGGDRFDIVASNFPFGNNITIYDDAYRHGDDVHKQAIQSINAYFPIKSLEKLENGGILAFITSRYFADSECYNYARRWMVENGNLLAAVRLPEGTFSENGTDTGADLIIFQRDCHKSYQSTEEMFFAQTRTKTIKGEDIKCINRLMALPKYAIYTDFSVKRNQFGENRPVYRWSLDIDKMGYELRTRLSATMERRFRKSAWLYGHDIMRRKFEAILLERANKSKTTRTERREEKRIKAEQMKPSYDALLTIYNTLRSVERSKKVADDNGRAELNRAYDEFVSQFGTLHSNEELFRKFKYQEYNLMLSTETLVMGDTYRKSDIFDRPIDFIYHAPGEKYSPLDALAMSLNERGGVDMGYIKQLSGMNTDEIYSHLKGEIFMMIEADGYPSWQHKSQTINGNVVEKRNLVAEWIDNNNNSKITSFVNDTLQALTDAIPAPVKFDEIGIQLGSRWMPIEYLHRFVAKLFDCSRWSVEDKVYLVAETDTWNVDDIFVHGAYRRKWTVSLDHNKDKEPYMILQYALDDSFRDIKYTIGKSTFTDHEGMRRVQKKVDMMREEWRKFLPTLPDADKREIEKLYNEKFNCEVRHQWDGSHQTFPDLTFDSFDYRDLYQSQKDCIWMLKQQNGGIGWHEVGAGKTMIMIVASYEMHRLGIAKKPLIICLKANVQQVADTYRKAYPTARILFPSNDDFKDENRREFFNKIASNDWTCVIMTHDQFTRIPQSFELQEEMINDELTQLERATRLLKRDDKARQGSRANGDLERAKNNLKNELAALKEDLKNRKDDTLTFHELGFDHIFIDECHMFKNLRFVTKHSRVGGLGDPKGSQRSWNMLVAIRDMQRRRGTDMCASFFSGTVVVNALTELYSIFRYLRPSALERQGGTCFDAWASNFCVKSKEIDITVTGDIKEREKFRSYQNVPELSAFLREITDFRTAKMVNIDRPNANEIFDKAEPSELQLKMLEALKRYAEGANWNSELLGPEPGAKKDKKVSRMLNVTNHSIKISLDPRLINPAFPDSPTNKASRCARNIKQYYDKFNEQRGIQFVFCDNSAYSTKHWNMISEVRRKLIEDHGIPANEIADIHEWDTDIRKPKLFEKLNKGEIRVVFGSTTKLGTGVNAQQRAVAVHHLDIPWRPADLEQRNGRALRKGNEVKYWGNNTVDIIGYGTERTFDSYKYQLLSAKQMFITQINSGAIARTIDEDTVTEEDGMSYGEYVAILSGNQDLMKRAKLDKKISQLTNEYDSYRKQQERASINAENATKRMEQLAISHERFVSDMNAALGASHVGIVLSDGTTNAELVAKRMFALRQESHPDGIVFGTYDGFPIRMVSVQYGPTTYSSFEIQLPSNLWYKASAEGRLGNSHADALAYYSGVAAHIQELIVINESSQRSCQKDYEDARYIIEHEWESIDELNSLQAERESLDESVRKDLEAKEQALQEKAKANANQ